MRVLTVITGMLLAAAGVVCIANSGLSFISVAFVIGIVLMFVGLVECFSYKRTKQDEESQHWLLIEGLTTFILGVVVITGQLAADIAVPIIFGMWVMISGIRGLVLVFKSIGEKNKPIEFYWTLAVGTLNFLAGIYTFFNSMLLHLPVLMMLGVCLVLQGINVSKIGLEMSYHKPDMLKTKNEKVEEATTNAALAHVAAKEAIKAAKEAKAAVKEAEEEFKTFDEIIEELITKEE